MKLPTIVRDALSHRCTVIVAGAPPSKIFDVSTWWYVTDNGVKDIQIALLLLGIEVEEVLINGGSATDDRTRWQINLRRLGQLMRESP